MGKYIYRWINRSRKKIINRLIDLRINRFIDLFIDKKLMNFR